MNIYMTFTLIIYISTDRIFVNVTMYCYIQIIHLFCYYVYSCMYIMYQNRTRVLVSMRWHIHGRQALFCLQKRGSWTCMLQIMWHKLAHTLELHWMQLHCIQLSVCNIHCKQYYDWIIISCYITWKWNWCSYISYIYNSFIIKNLYIKISFCTIINIILILYIVQVYAIAHVSTPIADKQGSCTQQCKGGDLFGKQTRKTIKFNWL